MKRCVVVSGADIQKYDDIRKYLRNDDYFIFCDSGLKHLDRLNVSPDLIIGDFDSYERPETSVETIVLPREKDDTDSVFGVKEGIRRGFSDFVLIGMVGQRFDHTMGNVSILLKLHSMGFNALLADDYSEMQVVSDKTVYVEDRYPYFSLLNISGTAKGIYIRNAKYCLENAEIGCEYQYGISNEVIPGKTAEITVNEGRLLLVKVR
ncbi:MAG: thiamine diphosphokinase [Bacteroidaceae bacterium]|nr:thiamine diphosphokinase [Bacteroidaceae bacterium]MCF0228363.1 thiamine diphosphokinase [Parasporobacterium sp.]